MMHISDNEAADREIMREIGRRLRALRKRQGRTIVSAAERAGLDRTTVARAEQGANPNLSTLLRLLRVYGSLAALEAFAPDPETGQGKETTDAPDAGTDGRAALQIATRVRVRPGTSPTYPLVGEGEGRYETPEEVAEAIQRDKLAALRLTDWLGHRWQAHIHEGRELVFSGDAEG